MNFLTLPQDRDFTPYAYPALFNEPYLGPGHVDIKPPLIHWSYKLWWKISGGFARFGLPARLRILPLLGIGFSVGCLITAHQACAAFVLMFLLASPTLWPHMANTEWLTISLIAPCLCIHGAPLSWCLLGFLPWANQKNVLLIIPLAWTLSLGLSWDSLYLLLPSATILLYLFATKRLAKAFYWFWLMPAQFGATRTFKVNTLSAARLLIPCIALCAPFIATMEVNRWAVVALCVLAVMALSKQIVPHHFLLLAFPIALSARPGICTILAVLLVWIPRDGICWWNASLTYRFTFGGGGGDYGALLADAGKIERWLRDNTPTEEVIWVNGMENQIYLNANRRAWRIEIPELQGTPQRVLFGYPHGKPRYIVHCAASAKKFDYEGYEPKMISTSGQFTLLVRTA